MDFLLLRLSEPRDDVWAEGMETSIRQALSTLDLGASKLSEPLVTCKKSICEIALLQEAPAADRNDIGWQTQFINIADKEIRGVRPAETALMSKRAKAERIAYFSYLHFARSIQ